VLVEICSGTDVGRNQLIMKTYAVDLHGEQDGNSELIKVTGCGQRSGTT